MDVTGAGSKMDVAGAGSRGGAPMTDREVADFTGRAVLRSAACDVGSNPNPYPNPNPTPTLTLTLTLTLPLTLTRSAACEGGQRAPTEKECLAATHAAHAARAGRNSHQPKETLKRVNTRTVPAGCTHGHASRMAVFNYNKAGVCNPATRHAYTSTSPRVS